MHVYLQVEQPTFLANIENKKNINETFRCLSLEHRDL